MSRNPSIQLTAEEESRPRSVDPLIALPKSTLIEFNSRSDIVRSEFVHVIVAWLLEQGLISSAQVLRDEASALLRHEHNERKVLRAISRAVNEGSWDAAHSQFKKLSSLSKSPIGSKIGEPTPVSPVASLLQSLPFLLAEQQFLEYVDEDDGQRAHMFFMRRIKPFEGILSKDHYQQLTYLLTCRTVSEAGGWFPRWRNWTSAAGRAQLQSLISKVIGHCDTSPYCRQYEFELEKSPRNVPKSLEQIMAESLSYELLKAQYPSLLHGVTTQPVASILQPLTEQLIPSKHIASVNVNRLLGMNTTTGVKPVQLTACQPFLQVPAVAVGTQTGSIVWIPMDESGSPTYCNESKLVIYQYSTPVRGMACHERQILLSWSGCQAVVINASRFMDKNFALSQSPGYPNDSVANTFSHTGEVYSCCLFPCGYIIATGLSDGTVTVWDLLSGGKILQNNFSSSAITSLTTNRSGSCYFAASKEGLVRIVDVVTGVLLFTFASPVAGEVSSIALSPSSSLLLVSYRNGMLRLWDILTGNLLPHRFEGIEGNTRSCSTISFGSTDTHIISGGDDGCLYLWDLGTTQLRGQQEFPSTTNVGNTSSENTTCGAKDSLGRLSSNPWGRYHWTVGESTASPKVIRLHRSRISDVKFQHQYVVTCGDDGAICFCSSMPRE